ncbi:glutamate synthase subunit beta [Dietzia timorensis]|uniref:Glutamate synthase [NADPH] small chain n=1 Tax=Dietzia timorensis TaxID=499555 RepID=A0A173LI70_9ACTN|nr:glutamate synthase subunit beta [Dietzia timorensis]ANI90987.1 Glutamate synthase [NADPH] small chain [Dietzia timorensis]
MADPKGFLKHTERTTPTSRPVEERVKDWNEVYTSTRIDLPILTDQASRCMNCGVPFCHKGCPLGNIIPEWNDMVYRGQWDEAVDRLHATNNFPEFTGRLCPAPCEGSCVLGINQPPVTIKQIEVEIAEEGWKSGYLKPIKASFKTGQKVAVVGSGPAGMAAAQQLTRAGHAVTVFERDDRIGGLMRYGIPEFKMEKKIIDRRIEQMEAEGTVFKTGVNVGKDITASQLRAEFDAVVLCGGATLRRDLPVPGRELDGIHQAMEFLPWANRAAVGDDVLGEDGQPPITAKDKNVIIIGGGDTGADCLGTATRQGAKSVKSFEIMPQPPLSRAASTPWPMYPLMLRTPSAHEENGERIYSVSTAEFVGENGKLTSIKGNEVKMVDGRFQAVEGSDFEFPADLVLLAMGFTGPQQAGLLNDLGVGYTDRGNVVRGGEFDTDIDGVFVAGDMGRGQSLIVWAIAEGRSAAAAVDRYLMGETALPSPIRPTDAPQR